MTNTTTAGLTPLQSTAIETMRAVLDSEDGRHVWGRHGGTIHCGPVRVEISPTADCTIGYYDAAGHLHAIATPYGGEIGTTLGAIAAVAIALRKLSDV